MQRNRKRSIPQLTINRSITTPLHRQIHDQLAAAIRNGEIPTGATLPSTRFLSRLLGISRNTVLTAYDELAAGGLADARPGSGIRVAGAGQSPAFHVGELLRDAHYPARQVQILDPDANIVNLNF